MTTQSQTQIHARFRSDTGAVDGTPTWLANEDTNANVDVSSGDVTLRVRFSIQENSASSTATNWVIRLSKNGGSYTAVTTATTSVKSADAGSDADETTINTQRLTSGTGTFQNGLYDETGSAGTSFAILSNTFTEFEFGITVISADVANGDTLDFRVYRATAALNAYTVTPRLTVVKTAAFDRTRSMFLVI